jgi:hypothetical protein
MATVASEQRMARRRRQREEAQWRASPEYLAFRHWLEARRRYLTRHPWATCPWVVLKWQCRVWGMTLGGRPPKARRCRKRLGSRFCWGWRVPGTDRCRRHPRPHTTRGEENGADPIRQNPTAQPASEHPLRQCALKPTVFGKHPLEQHPRPHGA